MSDEWKFNDLLEAWANYREAVKDYAAHEPNQGTGWDPAGDRLREYVGKEQEALRIAFNGYVTDLIKEVNP